LVTLTACVVGNPVTSSDPFVTLTSWVAGKLPTLKLDGKLVTNTIPDTLCVAGKLLTASVPDTGWVAGKLLTPTVPETGWVAGKLLTPTVPDTGWVAGKLLTPKIGKNLDCDPDTGYIDGKFCTVTLPVVLSKLTGMIHGHGLGLTSVGPPHSPAHSG
jgi:hypothetical protein